MEFTYIMKMGKKPNNYEILEDEHGVYAKISLTMGEFGFVDIQDKAEVGKYRYYCHKQKHTNYMITTSLPPIFVQDVIMGTIEAGTVDHLDGNGLNNRRHNLEIKTRSGNAHNTKKLSTNTSGYKGVSRHLSTNKFRVNLWLHSNQMSFGLFDNIIEAAEMYDMAKLKYHESVTDRSMNFPEKREQYLNYLKNNPDLIRPRSDNVTEIVGVSFVNDGRKKPWLAQFHFNKKRVLCKYFATKEEASRARDSEAFKYLKDKARLNNL